MTRPASAGVDSALVLTDRAGQAHLPQDQSELDGRGDPDPFVATWRS